MSIDQSTTSTARITLEDVRAAVGDTDPNQTNAAKIRAVLGRGSFDTIQKHLSTMRAELAAAMQPVSTDAVPPAPADLAQQIWSAAWAAAQVVAMRRTEQLTSERDAALLRLQTTMQDVGGLVATVDAQAAQIAVNTAAAAEAEAGHLAALAAASAATAEAKAQASALALALDRANADTAHAAALGEAGRLAMQAAMDRLTDQIGEMKAHLYKRAGVDTAGGE